MAVVERGALERVTGAIRKQVAELQQATLLRVDASARELYSSDLSQLASATAAMETRVRDVLEQMARDQAALPQLEAALAAASRQRAHLEHVREHLPSYLPSASSGAGPGAAALQPLSHNPRVPEPAKAPAPREDRPSSPSAAGSAPSRKDSEGAASHARPGPRPGAGGPPPSCCGLPRRFVSGPEFAGVSAYMRGRLTADKVNAALEELLAAAEQTQACLTWARRGRAGPGPLVPGAGPVARERAQWLAYSLAAQEPLRGRAWVAEQELRHTSLRPDKTGKATLTLLRHLGRIAELRVLCEGSAHVVYVVNV